MDEIMLSRNSGKMDKVREELVLKGVSIIQRFEKLKNDKELTPNCKKLVAKALHKELVKVKKEMEKYEHI